MKLKEQLSLYWLNIQDFLFPWLKEALGELTEKQKLLATVLEVIRIEEFLCCGRGYVGRPAHDRTAIARAFVAKAVFNLPTTRALLDRLKCDITLRRICGWERYADIPDESTFSRAFGEFSEIKLGEQVHQALIKSCYQGNDVETSPYRVDEVSEPPIVGHLSRDATQIEGREKPIKKPVKESPKRKRGRPRKGEEALPKEPSRLDRQLNDMSLEEMLTDLPVACDVGTKKNSKGYKESWVGYKLHLDVVDGQIPVSCILTSASTHDSQVAIPLAKMSSQRVTNLYDLMDSAYDAPQIKTYSASLGHVPIIDMNPRRDKALKAEQEAEARRLNLIHFQMPEDIRYNERSTVERVNGRLKDEFGGRTVRVRGHAKVMTHLMFGIIALTVDQLMKLAEIAT